ncbi:MAG: PAS domain S-box protein [Methanomicrobiales archaeon]|nr:PAS domain S-box protein [Methanomicrobiales archaeon]
MNGLTRIFPLLYYPPIILAAYWFLKRGLIYAGILGLIYLSIVMLMTHGDMMDTLVATARVSFFMVLAAVVMVLTMEISDKRRQMEQSELKFRTIWEHIEAGIILVDADTHEILAVNPEAERMTWFKQDELVGKTCHQLISPARKGECPVSDLNMSLDHADRILLTRNGLPMRVLKSVTRATIENRDVFIESYIPATPHTHPHEKIHG